LVKISVKILPVSHTNHKDKKPAFFNFVSNPIITGPNLKHIGCALYSLASAVWVFGQKSNFVYYLPLCLRGLLSDEIGGGLCYPDLVNLP
jgi:hypothetical protein